MNALPTNTLPNATRVSRERFSRGAVLIIVLAGLAAYANSFSGAFVFDDIDSIVSNPAIRHLWPPWKFFATLNRPILNLSLAVSYATWGRSALSPTGLNSASFHAFNIAVHILAALTLFGLVRRTLRLPALRARFEGAATALALATALIWEVHPLQTESVTYIIQRAESLAGLFYLLTLYCVARGALSDRPLRMVRRRGRRLRAGDGDQANGRHRAAGGLSLRLDFPLRLVPRYVAPALGGVRRAGRDVAAGDPVVRVAGRRAARRPPVSRCPASRRWIMP